MLGEVREPRLRPSQAPAHSLRSKKPSAPQAAFSPLWVFLAFGETPTAWTLAALGLLLLALAGHEVCYAPVCARVGVVRDGG